MNETNLPFLPKSYRNSFPKVIHLKTCTFYSKRHPEHLKTYAFYGNRHPERLKTYTYYGKPYPEHLKTHTYYDKQLPEHLKTHNINHFRFCWKKWERECLLAFYYVKSFSIHANDWWLGYKSIWINVFDDTKNFYRFIFTGNHRNNFHGLFGVPTHPI